MTAEKITRKKNKTNKNNIHCGASLLCNTIGNLLMELLPLDRCPSYLFQGRNNKTTRK
jgi:hypothetical protein